MSTKNDASSIGTSGGNVTFTLIGWPPLAILATAAIMVREKLPPWGFMWTLAAAIYAGLKWLSWWKARVRISHASWRSFAYLFAWPGMDAESFLDPRRHVSSPTPGDWLWAVAKAALGCCFLWIIARKIPVQHPLLRGWIGMLGLVLLLHFGSFHLFALLWQSFGVDAEPIMASPLRSVSLAELWGKRWNLGFRQLGYDLIFQPLHKRLGVTRAGFLVFVVSGLIHDLVISLPARGGYGLPTTYFVIQGAGVALERSALGSHLGLGHGVRGWFFTAAFAAGPAYWLFHPPFVLRVIIPFMQAVRAI